MVTHLTPDQKIIGSNPIWVKSISFLILRKFLVLSLLEKAPKRFLLGFSIEKRFDCAKSILFAEKKECPNQDSNLGFCGHNALS